MRKLFTFLLALFSCTLLIAQTENFWTKKNDFSGGKRERAVGISINDIGYLGMGTDTDEVTRNDWWAYDALNDVWAQRAALPGSVRRNAVCGTINGKGYVGLGIDSNEAGPGTPLKDFWEYDPVVNQWTQLADYPGAGGNGIYFATGFVLDDKFYVVGGKTGPGALSDEVWEYKPFNNSWYQRADFPGGGRYQMSSFAVGGKAYVGLGADQNTYRDEMWEYNAGSGQWDQKADFAGGDRGQATTFVIAERGFVCLGRDGGLKSDLWEYNPYTDAWTARASYGGSARSGAAGFVCYGKAYIGTGDGYTGKKESMWEYTPVLVLGIHDAATVQPDIYPNPASDRINISGLSGKVHLELTDVHGQVVYTSDTNGISDFVINCESFASGCYILAVTGPESGNSQHKIIVR